MVTLLGAGDFFREGSLAGETLRLATVSALTKCAIARISKADITRVIHEEPAFAELSHKHRGATPSHGMSEAFAPR